MHSVTIPEILSVKINEIAGLFRQRPDEFIIEILENYLSDAGLSAHIEYKKDDFWTALMNFRQETVRDGIQIDDSEFAYDKVISRKEYTTKVSKASSF